MQPKRIALDQISAVIADTFKKKDEIICYIGSNAATPTASIEALTKSIKSQKPELPFINMVHILLQGNRGGSGTQYRIPTIKITR